jgi:hypothetical protein
MADPNTDLEPKGLQPPTESIDVKPPVQEATPPEQESQTPETDPAEVEARAAGWVPREEFEANPANAGKKWRSAELFVELTPLFEKIDSLHKQNKTLNQGLKAFAEHNKKIEVNAYNRAKAELLAEKKKAAEEGDVARVEAIRDEIDALPKPQVPVVQDLPEAPNAEFLKWKTRNSWYSSNEDAKLFADTYGVKLAQSGLEPDAVLRQVTQKVQQVFPDLFVNPKRESAPNVESGGTRSKSAGGFSLTSEETAIMNRLISSGAPITRDEYIAQIKRTRGA